MCDRGLGSEVATDLTIPVPHRRCSHTAVPTIPGLCWRRILPAHAGSGASLPRVRLDFAFRESRREGRDKPGDSKNRSAGILAKHR